MNFIKKNIYLILFFAAVLIFFSKTVFSGLLPIPSDTIVGLYHPFLDMYAKISPAGVPFQNFLITDPVRQIIPWKTLVIDNLRSLYLPLWNPYEMIGKPLLGNFQSGPFYPLNFVLFFKPFIVSWSIFIISQSVLSGIFIFFFLRNLKLDDRASLFGAVSFVFGGFSIVWLEWGNIVHTALWLPLILLSIDKILKHFNSNQEERSKKLITWSLIFVFSLVFSFFAGHLQIFFYLIVFSFAYLLFRLFEFGKKLRISFLFFILYLIFFILTSIQWIPALQFINLSARSIDQNPLLIEGWFIPLQHLIQFLAPDFFGNPATLNYWGTWNYAEFIGYIGVIGLFFAFYSIFAKNKREIFFFLAVIIISLLFALPTSLAKIPFNLSIPFISSAQPTRLIFLISFSMSILSAFGFNSFITKPNIKKAIGVYILLAISYSILWLVVYQKIDFKIAAENLLVSRRNLIFPSIIFASSIPLIVGISFIRNRNIKNSLIILVMALSFYDLYRFGTKFTPFTTPNYFFPETSVIKFLKNDFSLFRIAVSDSRVFPPNFSAYYKITSIEGYDPLYLLSYAELIAASEREDHSIRPPFGFNRIITPHNINSKIIDLLNVKYALSISDLDSPKLTKVFQEGQTRVYENKNVFPRAFFVNETISKNNKKEIISGLFDKDLRKVAYVEWNNNGKNNFTIGNIRFVNYSDNKIEIETNDKGQGFLVLTDAFYPTWKATIDAKQVPIYKTDYVFRGILVPAGKHKIVFHDKLF